MSITHNPKSWTLLSYLITFLYIIPFTSAGINSQELFCPGAVPEAVAESAPAFSSLPYTGSEGLKTLCSGGNFPQRPNVGCGCMWDFDPDSPRSLFNGPGEWSSSGYGSGSDLSGSGSPVFGRRPRYGRNSGVRCVGNRLADSMFYDGRNNEPLAACLTHCSCIATKPAGLGLRLAGLRINIAGAIGDGSGSGGRELKSYGDPAERMPYKWEEVNGRMVLVKAHTRPGRLGG